MSYKLKHLTESTPRMSYTSARTPVFLKCAGRQFAWVEECGRWMKWKGSAIRMLGRKKARPDGIKENQL